MPTTARTLATGALLALGLAAAPAAATAADAPSADPTPERIAEIERYYESGAWKRDADAVAARALRQLRASVRRAREPRRLVAVFDVDDTALSTYDCMKAGFFTDGRRTACVVTGPHTAIAGVLKLFRYAQQRRVRVAFVTGRPEYVRTLTLQQLRRAGFRGRYQLLLRPSDDRRHSVVPFKSSARRSLQRGGRRVVLNIGDQRSDLAGGVAQRTFKLPNPMYTLP
ncbi:HAD family acid phosphatase [Conexibacter arvalis]|uniref:Putative secreted acid phosphatase n=1 Tax=Conexibacter arvalis TaxID=912552 RepID=A0A840IFT5_9ACTN|nr:HAD family acid phosphatase [Conexibacter arvalis]MBB4663722.1 putative secreted acid phosphatase [Conexibacter arvalis]